MRRALLAAALIAGLATPVMAHRGHAGLTVIEIDPASGAVSVVHRFSAHDVEPALVSIAPAAQPSLDDPRAVAELETHLRQRFRLDIDGAAIPVTHAGTDLAGDNIRVEYSGETSDRSIAAVTIDLDFFPGVHDDQEQQVNVRINGVTRTVLFRPGSEAQTVTFGG
jgi:hypothetical protein